MPHPIRFVAVLLSLAAAATAQSGWSAPSLETSLNSVSADTGPHLSLDGLTLHFSSNVSGPAANYEIYVTTRAFVGGPWSPPALVSVSDPALTDDQPFLTADGLSLYFGSTNRPGGVGSIDIWVATRPNAAAPWGVPVNVTELNSTGLDSSFSMTADGLEAYFLTTGWGNPGGSNNSVFRATRASTSAPFGTPTLVSEFFTGNTHRDCEVAPDGLSIVYTEFFSSRLHVMYAERPTRSAAFGAPVEWTEFTNVGTATGVFSFTRSLAANEAFLAVGFAAAAGSQEIMTTRFTGLTRFGAATATSTASMIYRDAASAGMGYMMGAALGNAGFMIDTRTVPLSPDFLLVATLSVSVPPFTAGFAGLLDGSGEGIATLTNAGGFLTGFPQVWVGAFTLDPAAPNGIRTISNSLPVLFH